MKKNYKKISSKLLFCALSSLFLTTTVNAGTLTIKSNETADVDLLIEPGVGTVLPNKESIKAVLHPKEEKEFEVNKDTFGTDTFSVTGKVKVPSVDNKCELLSVDKSYVITFTGTKMGGTICKAEEATN